MSVQEVDPFWSCHRVHGLLSVKPINHGVLHEC